jgi:DNA-binding transcriptional ArsR family regulator
MKPPAVLWINRGLQISLLDPLTYSQLAIYYFGVMRHDRQDRIFRAVADPTRRSILERLHQRELAVLEIGEPFRITQPSLSKHLAVLRRSGLIAVRRSGRHRYYRLASEPLEQIAAWAAQFRDVRDPSGHVWRLTQINQRKDR